MSTRARKSAPAIRFRIDFDEQCSVGIGKITLLEAVADTGSLSQAARRLGMSYRRAWLLVDSMNAEFDTPVISATVGGSGGGGAQLTDFGRELARAYRALEGSVATLVARSMGAIAAHVASPRRHRSAPGATPRQRLARPLR